MGNLLGAPITEKETHRGVTKDEELKFGLSSMQGWRVHMEDAHIAEGDLYALDNGNVNSSSSSSSSNGNGNSNAVKIALPGHSLFAVYDGHGGTFAAIYSGNNFLRILCKQPKFVQYAKMVAADNDNNNNNDNSTTTTKSTRAAKMQVLEKALKQAFVETDYEIGLAIRGKSHADANSPYHDDNKDVAVVVAAAATDDDDDTTTTTNTNTNMQAGAAMKAASDHLSAIEDEGDSGTTSCVVMITPDSIVCANAGDSRAVFARRPLKASTTIEDDDDNNNSNNDNDNNSNNNNNNNNHVDIAVGKAIPLSFDHKPDDEEEERRVRNAGGYVAGGRVEGDLAVSRGLGDFRFKQMAVVLNNTQLYPEDNTSSSNATAAAIDNMATDDEGDDENDNSSSNNNASRSRGVAQQKSLIFPPGDQKVSPIPDVIVHTRNAERDEYVVVACDGIWDVVSNQQCVAELDEIMYAEGERDLGLVSEEILDTCLRYGSKDNMTAIVIQLPGCEQSYADAAAPKTNTNTNTNTYTSTSTNTDNEGVTGRRRKREEVISGAVSAQQHQQGDGDGGSNQYIDASDEQQE